MRKGLCWLLAIAFALAPTVSHSQQANDAAVPSTGKPNSFWPGGGWDGTAMRNFRTDPNGILRMTEEYPITSQTEIFTAATTYAVYQGLKQMGNGWSVAPFGDRCLRVRRTTTGTNGVDPCYLYLFGSDDNVNFFPLTPDVWSTSATDTTKSDTLMTRLPAGASGVAYEYKVPLPTSYPGRYLAIFAKRDSTGGTTQSLTLTFEGRQR